jgi:hypothetical protein
VGFRIREVVVGWRRGTHEHGVDEPAAEIGGIKPMRFDRTRMSAAARITTPCKL